MRRPPHRHFGLGCFALLLLVSPSWSQEAKPLVIQGELTAKDPFDRVRKESHHKVHELKLKAGEIYLIELKSSDFDTYLRLEDAGGKTLGQNDDISAADRNSRLGFVPKKTDSYRAVVTTFKGGVTGAYTISVGTLRKVGSPKLIDGKLTEKSPKFKSGWPYETHKLEFKAGEFWMIDVGSKDFVPFLSLGIGKMLINSNAGGGQGTDARIVVGAAATGTHYLLTGSVKVGVTGEYQIQVQSLARTAPGGLTQEERWRNEATELNRRGLDHLKATRYAEAEVAFKESLALREKLYPKSKYPHGHSALAQGLNNLAFLYFNLGNYVKAGPLYQQALEIHRKVLGEKHSDFATSLNNLAALYQSQGAYAKAEPLLQQALEIRRKVLGEKHPDFATSLNNLAFFYQSQGASAKAEPLYQQALEIHRKILGEKHPDFAGSLDNLAGLYQSQRAYAKAEPLHQQALEIRRKILGEKHPDFANSLDNLAGLYQSQGAYAKAEPLHQQALEIRRKVLGEKHPDFALSLNNLAFLYLSQGKANEAETLYQQALEIRRNLLGDKHPDFASSLNKLARVYLSQGNIKDAEKLGHQSAQIVGAHLDATAAVQTELVQSAFLSKQRFYLNNYLSFSAAADTPAADAYALLLPWKGAVTARQRWTRAARSALTGADKDTTLLFTKLDDVTRQYANLINRPVDPKNVGDLPKRLRDLDSERNKLEVDLARRTEAFRKLRQAKQMTPAQLQKSLPDGTVLVDFLVYQKREAKKSIESLVAFVVTSKKIERIELGAMAPFTTAIDDFLRTLKRGQPVTGEKDPALTLRDNLWQPVAKHLDLAKVILISPDGALCRLPFAALPSADGKKYLLEEHLIAVLPVPQMLPELLAPAKDRPKDWLPSMLALGDVDFDAVPGLPQKISEWKPRRAGEAMSWALPGTKGEILAIEDSFTKAIPKGKLRLLRDAAATEAEFRRQATAFEYLHLATHGFFAPKEVKSALKGSDKDDPLLHLDAQAPRFVGHHPGLLSGIVLAGANKPAADGDDGVLTALEVAELDLSKVELAVLSACETGLGEVAGGEGVLGLQRAFQIAGARSTITSLWKVDDDATRKLMERFYDNYWKKNMGTLESLREAQLWLLNEGPTRGIVRLEKDAGPHRAPPYYWAAFVLSGDWR